MREFQAIFAVMKDTMKTGSATKTKSATASRPLQIQSILVPIDFSPPSKQALDFAVTFARQFKARLTLLHVIEPVAAPEFVTPLAMEEDKVIAIAKNELESVIKAAGIPRGLVEKVLVRVGRSYREITEAARTRKVGVIIISTHGYTGLKHAVLGSTTERVVRHAPCPVLVLRQC
jgi:nucleotide-binding universal stress UspA family protein